MRVDTWLSSLAPSMRSTTGKATRLEWDPIVMLSTRAIIGHMTSKLPHLSHKQRREDMVVTCSFPDSDSMQQL